MTTVIECHPPVVVKQPGVDINAIKTKQQAAWSSGDYAVIGTTLQIVGERLAEAMDLRAGKTVLDVAAGNGNITLAAARRWCEVTSTDYVGYLLELGRKRAEAEGLQVKFQVADAEACRSPMRPSTPSSPTLGGMFSPDQDRTAAEMVRVCRSGGNDRPRQLDARRLHRTNVQDDRKVPAAADRRKSPAVWGTREWVQNDIRRCGVRGNSGIVPLYLPVPLGAALPRHLPNLPWAGT